jgi:hypothetical protein
MTTAETTIARLFERFARTHEASTNIQTGQPLLPSLVACRLNMGAHQSVTRVMRIVGGGCVNEKVELEAASDRVVLHLQNIHESQVVNRCFYVDLLRASRRLYGQPDNDALQALQLKIVDVLRANMQDLTSTRYHLGDFAALARIVDSLLRPVDWSATIGISNTILTETRCLLDSISCMEEHAMLKSDSFKTLDRQPPMHLHDVQSLLRVA